MNEHTNTPAAPPKKNHAWIYYFAFLIIASVGVAGFMIWYNLSIQLTAPQLEDAAQLWRAKGPTNYNMVYTKRLNDDAKIATFNVEVRAGKVTKVLMNGRLLEKDQPDDADPRIHHSMDRLFHDIERFMDIDRKPGAPKVYVTAIFDDKNGGLRRYIRRVMGTTLRIEMHVTVTPVEKDT